MKIKNRILVVQRQTNVSKEKKIDSRSVAARVVENFSYLGENDLIDFEICSEQLLSDDLINDYDTFIFQKHTSDLSLKLVEKVKDKRKKVIYDIDDFLPAFPQYSGGTAINEKIGNIKKHLNYADIVTTATPFLKTHIDKYFNVSSNVVVNGINVEKHRKYLKPNDSLNMIFTNADMLKVNSFKDDFFKFLDSVYLKYRIKVDVISDPNTELEKFNKLNFLGNFEWFHHKEIMAHNNYKIGIVPLGGEEDQDSYLFNCCKSPIKYLEYAALGIVGLYSDVPIYREVINHESNGMLIKNSLDDWISAVDKLVNNTDFRIKLENNALADVIENHHVRISAKQWFEVLKN